MVPKVDKGMRHRARAMLLEEFGTPLRGMDLPVPSPEAGGALVRLAAAGVCGSDLEITEHRDPRVRSDLLPLIPGHEGVGWVERTGGDLVDLLGAHVRPGDLVVWNRGISCGKCYQCAVKRRRALCPHREVYGISLPAREPYWLNGCYAEMIYVRPGSELLVLPQDTDPATIVPATCSGATAAHAIELCGISLGDQVAVIGPGPLGLFCAAFALARGARRVLVLGTARSAQRLALADEMGCETLLGPEVGDWDEPGFDVVIDAAGSDVSVRQALAAVGSGGTVAIPGVASPIGKVSVDIYEKVARKNVRLQGVWVSDARHLYEAVELIRSRRYGLERLVTHRFGLSQANEALAAVKCREATKAVLLPD